MASALFDLLAKGYFPKELPPNFSTASYGSLIEEQKEHLPSCYRKPKKLTFNCKHSFSRSRVFRRELMLPNPITHYHVCNVISENWHEINSLISRSKFTTSKPVQPENIKRAFVPETERDMLAFKRASLRSSSSVILKTDLSEFYHSIYTHSLPWAIHGKSVAKIKRTNDLWGNLLDFWVRNGQDGQTIGIPVGPDSSLIIAEVLMSAIDVEIDSSIKHLKGIRYFDDYEFSFSSRSGAEAALNIIGNIVNDYGLRLNPIKTRILELPQRFEETWISKLRTYNFSSNPSRQKLDVTDYFDLACDYYNQFPDSNVFTYAIARLRSETINDDNWNYVQYILSQAMTVEPGVLPICFWIILKHIELGCDLNKELLTNCINNLIARLCPLGYSNELAWCLWGAMAFRLKIPARVATLLEQTDDNVLSLLVLDAETKGTFTRKISKAKWWASITRKSLYDENWLITYESTCHGWTPMSGANDFIADDEMFSWLKEHDVTFYTPFEYPVNKSDLEEYSSPATYIDDENSNFDDYSYWPDDD